MPRRQWSARPGRAAPRVWFGDQSRRRGGSFDDLIRSQQQRLRDGQAERLRGLEVDDQFEFRGLLHRDVTRRRAPQDLVDERRGALVHRWEVWAVARECAIVSEESGRRSYG